MQTLIIHPEDATTNFLCPIYESIKDKKVIRGGISKQEVLNTVESFNRIIMLGHGSPNGLFAVNQFIGEKFMSLIVDDTFVATLKNKDNLFIWCHANLFVEKYDLTGFYSGMFISEILEAKMYDYNDVSQECVNESNNTFSEIVGKCVHLNSNQIFEKVKNEYGLLTEKNPIAKFNHDRLYFN